MTNFSNEGIDKLIAMLQMSAKSLGPVSRTFIELYKKTNDKRLLLIMDNLADTFLHLDQAAQQISHLKTKENFPIEVLDQDILKTEQEYQVQETKVSWLKLISRTKDPDKDK